MAKHPEVQQRIYKALEELLRTRTLAEVKVIDLCKVSGVPKSTFYTYFCDVYSVPQIMWDDLMVPTLYKIGDTLTWNEGHRAMFTNLLINKSIFTKIYWENDRNSILEYGYRGGYSAIKKNVEHRKRYFFSNEESIELDYTIKALASLTTKWGRDGMVVPVEKIVSIFYDHVPDFLRNLCDN